MKTKIKPQTKTWIRAESVSIKNVLQEHFDQRVNCTPRHSANDSKFVRRSVQWKTWGPLTGHAL